MSIIKKTILGAILILFPYGLIAEEVKKVKKLTKIINIIKQIFVTNEALKKNSRNNES